MRTALFRTALVLAIPFAVACPEPPPGGVGNNPGAGGAPPPPPGGQGGGGESAGAGGSAGPGEDGSRIPAGMRIEPEGFELAEGEGVKLSGTVSYAGDQEGDLRVELLQSTDAESPPALLHAINLDKLGPWSVVVPEDLGEIRLVAYIDLDQNGPSPGEPMAMLDHGVQIGTDPVQGIDLVIEDGAEPPTTPGGVEPTEGQPIPEPPPGEAPADAPVEAPADAPVEAPADAPVEAPVE
jgi:hypothetical protein